MYIFRGINVQKHTLSSVRGILSIVPEYELFAWKEYNGSNYSGRYKLISRDLLKSILGIP